MKVLDGQSTTSPLTSANASAASAAPDQLPNATAGRPFDAAHAASNSSVMLSLRPALGRDRPIPQLVQPRQVAPIEADRELLA